MSTLEMENESINKIAADSTENGDFGTKYKGRGRPKGSKAKTKKEKTDKLLIRDFRRKVQPPDRYKIPAQYYTIVKKVVVRPKKRGPYRKKTKLPLDRSTSSSSEGLRGNHQLGINGEEGIKSPILKRGRGRPRKNRTEIEDCEKIIKKSPSKRGPYRKKSKLPFVRRTSSAEGLRGNHQLGINGEEGIKSPILKRGRGRPRKIRPEIVDCEAREVLENDGEVENDEEFNLGAMMLEDKTFVDVEIVLGEKVFKAHKAVLSCYSEFFSELCKEMDRITLTCAVNPEVFSLILDFMYKGKVKISNKEELVDIFYFAAKYKVNKLMDICIEQFIRYNFREISPETGIKLLEIAAYYEDSHEALDAILMSIKLVYQDIKKIEAWKEFVKDAKYAKVVQRLVYILDLDY